MGIYTIFSTGSNQPQTITVELALDSARTTVAYPLGRIQFGTTDAMFGAWMFGGTSQDNPETLPPAPVMPLPNCATLQGVFATTYNLGGVVPGEGTGVLQPDGIPVVHSLNVSCQSDPASGSKAASAILSVQSSNALVSPTAILMSDEYGADDYIGLKLKILGGLPAWVTPISPLTAGGTEISFAGASATPQWAWALPAANAGQAPTTAAVKIAPELTQVKPKGSGYVDGQRTYRITYSVVIQ